MCIKLAKCSAVVVARDVNVSIFKPLWLRTQNVLSEEEASADDMVIAPNLVRIPAPLFELFIIADRIQIRPSTDSDDAQADILRVLGGIVSALPHTPFTALGLNFDYEVRPPASGSFEDWNRKTFAGPFAARVIPEGGGEPRFGGYVSFDVFNMRLKIQVIPVRVPGDDGTEEQTKQGSSEAMSASFNFHRDLDQPVKTSEILESLGRWDTVRGFASEAAKKLSCLKAGMDR